MAKPKQPCLLVILIHSARRQWFVAAVDLDASLIPLIRSEPDNLDRYAGRDAEEQLSFLRHRLSGAMQRGCDRLWARERKAASIVVIASEDLPGSADELLPQLAEHLHTWMTRPPVITFRGEGFDQLASLDDLDCLAGSLDDQQHSALQSALPNLAARTIGDDWEVAQKPQA